MKHARAFTLIEVLLALSILGVVLLAGQTLVASTAAAQERIEGISTTVAGAQSLTWLLREDLRGALGAEAAAKVFHAADTSRGEMLAFVTVSDPLQRETSGVWRVAYGLQANRDDPQAFDLFRAQSAWPLTQTSSWEPVFRRFSRLRLEYFDGAKWLSAWPEGRTWLPMAARVTLKLRSDDGKDPESYSAVLWVPAGSEAPKETP